MTKIVNAQREAAKSLVETQDSSQLWKTFKLIPLKELRKEWEIHSFQQYSIYKSLNQAIFIMGMQTGLGKTLCSLAAYFYYCTKYPDTKLLVVCNKSAVLQFRQEIEKFFIHDKRVMSIHQGMDRLEAQTYPNARKNAIEMFASAPEPLVSHTGLDGLIMNYAIFRIESDNLKKVCKKIRKKGQHIFTIFDECTYFGNYSNFHKTHKAAKAISKLSNRVMGTTATMTKGKLEQIYAIYAGMGFQIYPNKKAFEFAHLIVWRHPRHRYISNITGYKNVGYFVDLIKKYSIVLKKSDVASQLPAFQIKKEFLEHSPEQIRLITDIYSGFFDVENYSLEAKDNSLVKTKEVVENPFKEDESLDPNSEEWDGTQVIHAVTQSNFIKMALLDPNVVLRQPDVKAPSPKTIRLLEMLESEFTDEKIVIYTYSKRYLILLAKTILKHKTVPDFYKKPLMIHGGISEVKRQEAMNLFTNTNEYNILLLNKAGIESINLQAANTIIVMDMPPSGGDLIQLAGRVSRINSKHSVLFMIYMLMQDSQDVMEYEIIQEQMALASHVIGEAETNLIDWDLLRIKKSKRLKETLSKEEYQEKSLIKHIITKRKSLAQFYVDQYSKLKN